MRAVAAGPSLGYVAAMAKHAHRDMRDTRATADFGFRRVDAAEKSGLVRGVFDSVAPNYDLMNDLMSLGIHRLWKSAMIDWLRPRADMTLIDVGGGTGDIAFRFRERGGGPVTVVDVNEAMLERGQARALDNGIMDGITWLAGDAEDLPLDDAVSDAYTTAFCLRNVTHVDRALEEAHRVLKPGGRFLCLEFSRLALPALDGLYDAWSFKVLPALGARVANDREAYRYLAESIRRFPPQDEFAALIAKAGLGQVKVRNLTGGIAALHSAWRL